MLISYMLMPCWSIMCAFFIFNQTVSDESRQQSQQIDPPYLIYNPIKKLTMKRIRQIILSSKKELLLGLFAAGCATIAYSFWTEDTLTVQLQTFKKLLSEDLIQQVSFKNNEVYFKTLLPDSFQLELAGVGLEQIKELIKEGMQIEIEFETQSLFEKYKLVIEAVAGAFGLLIGKYLHNGVKRIERIKVAEVQALQEYQHFDKIQSIPRHLSVSLQQVNQNGYELGRSEHLSRQFFCFSQSIKQCIKTVKKCMLTS